MEPENHVAEIVEGHRRSPARLPLVVVGSAPYADAYGNRVRDAAAGDPRIRLVGGVWDQELLDQMYAGCATYLHGHSVGGTNPSLLRAMGAGAPVIAYDVSFNHEVAGPDALFFAGPDDVAAALLAAEDAPAGFIERGQRLRGRAATRYQWSEVADGYEALLKRLAAGESVRGSSAGRRRHRAAP